MKMKTYTEDEWRRSVTRRINMNISKKMHVVKDCVGGG